MHTRPEDFQAQFDTNVLGVIKVTRALLPHFRSRRFGNIVFISSLSGWIGHPRCSAYAGSKFALEGMVESLRNEVSHLGIRTLLIEPGRFRTLFLSEDNRKSTSTKIDEYEQDSRAMLEGLAGEDRTQPGDPVKLVDVVLDLVRQEGVAAGREVPFRLPLGIDCYDAIKEKCEETLRVLKDWETIIRSTEHDNSAT
jgi:NAD(P)-dependent dehydrogenase (short-subunit alcohol dehydrogenase family)